MNAPKEHVLMLVMSDVHGDARVLKEAASLSGVGYRVTIIGKDVEPRRATSPGISVLAPDSRASATSTARRRGVPRVIRWLLLPEHRHRVERAWIRRAAELAQQVDFDVVHAHDLPTLALGRDLARSRGVPLVYDSHEWWRGRKRHGRPTPLARWRQAQCERRLCREADAVLTVSPEIQQCFAADGILGVQLVRNTFASGVTHGPTASGDLTPRGVVYAGRVAAGRDLETLIAASAAIRPLRTVLVGPQDPNYVRRLAGASADVFDPVSIESLDEVLQHWGIAAVTLTDDCDNHRMALPNKVFHAVRAGVPVVAADLPSLRRLVTNYELGVLYRPGDPSSFSSAVADVIGRYGKFCRSVRACREELSWEVDERVLLECYARLRERA